jgi:hypothetical protein
MQRSVPLLFAVSGLVHFALLPDITTETPPSQFRGKGASAEYATMGRGLVWDVTPCTLIDQ